MSKQFNMLKQFNLEEYIKFLLQEQAEINEQTSDEFKNIDAHPYDVDFCFKKWVQVKPNLKKEDVEKYIKTFLKYIKPKITNGFNQPELLTFFIKYINKEPRIFPNLEYKELQKVYNTKYTKAEILLKDPKVQQAMNNAVQKGENMFEYGQEAKRDANGNVELIGYQDSKGNFKQKPKEMVPVFYNTQKMLKSLQTLKEKEIVLEPFMSKISDPKNYSLQQFKFLLDEFNQNLIELDAEIVINDNEIESEKFGPSPENTERSRKESSNLQSRNLVWKSNDNKIRIYNIPNQATSIRFGYYFGEVYRRLNQLADNRNLIHNPNGYKCAMQWCVTQSQLLGYYSSYRSRSGNDYKYYLLVNDNYNFMDYTDQELAELPEDSPLRDFEHLMRYGNIICVRPVEANGRSSGLRIVDLRDDESNAFMSWENIEKFFPGFTREVAEEHITHVPFSGTELFDKSDKKNRYVYDLDSDDYIGAASQADKSAYIQGLPERDHYGNDTGRMNRGTINNAEVWRTLSKKNKEEYIKYTEINNIYDKFKSIDIFYELLSEKTFYNIFLKKIGLLEQASGESGILDKLKLNLLKNNYDEVFRKSSKNNDIKLMKVKNKDGIFNLIDTRTLSKLQTKEQDYFNDYMSTRFYINLMDKNNKGQLFTATLYGTSKDPKSTGPDSFFCIFDVRNQNKHTYFVNKRYFDKLVKNGDIILPENWSEGDFGEIDSSIFNREEIFESKK
jgi:hypothetical protein